MSLLAILISVLTITILIVVHEFGHYLAAKYYGFQTPVFGIGLPIGPAIDLGKKWGTQFKFYWCLIGGFVAIPELGDETDPETIKKYDVKLPLKEFPVGQRMIVASGGIIFNILFAFLIAVIMAASFGLPKVISSSAIAAFGSSDSAAKTAGLQIGDKIIAIDGTEIKSGKALQKAIKETTGKTIAIKLLRNKETLDITLTNPGALGVVLGQEKIYKHYGANPLSWLKAATKFTLTTLLAMVLSVMTILASLVTKIFSIFIPNLTTGADLGQVKGIVGIVQVISQDISSNFLLILEFAFLLSLNLAVINVLPIPALDGGHLLFMTYEAITGKKAPDSLQQTAIQVGFVFLLGVIALTTVNDIKNWIWG